ncbi:hypothetical protein [Desertibaculum subflavum]|uniref:hypothetical protein n=1 Tax=Desertibaculum subflavum TaxID=2268458 RepID=UPI000E66556F
MPLRTIDPPLQAFEAVRAKLADLAAFDGFRTPSLRRADTGAIALSTPHRTALLRLDRIKGAADLRRAAEPKGWRFLLHEGDRVVAAVETQDFKGQHRFGQVNEGPFTAATEQAIRRAESLDQVKRGRYTPTFLLVPAIYVAALWLEDEAGEADLVIPLAPAPPELKPMEPIAARAFLAVLAKLAARVPPEDRRARDPSGG